MQYKITKVYKRYMDCFVEADSPEEALKAAAAEDAEWEWDNIDGPNSYRFDGARWNLLDEDDELVDEGEYTDEQTLSIASFGGNVTGW
ncbi:MAG: hypothetical protein IKY83_09405 [Proteobacteria bacterium]|nr:hypothetical protein [Pseudomonadota bacterium]